MINHFLRLILVVFPLTLLGGATAVFLVVHLVPGDPVLMVLNDYFTNESYETVQRRLGLDRPLHVQYLDFLKKAVQLDFGVSFQNRRPVASNIAEQFGYTSLLAGAALILAVIIAIPAGVISALNRGRWPDYVTMSLALLAVSSPSFVIGIMLLYLFSLQLGWLPSFGVGSGVDGVFKHLVLPSIALSATMWALLTRVARASMIEVLNQDYIRTARAKGLNAWTIIVKHGLRNATIPLITIIGMDIAYLLGGSVVIETVFSRRGVGRLLLNSILTRDYPQIQGLLLILIFVTVLMNSLVDVLYAVANPRVRYQ